MNRITINFSTIMLLIGVFFTSCKKDILNTQPLGELSSTAVWSDPALASAFVNNIYTGLGQGGFEEQMLASLSDEAVFTHTGRGINTINEGSLSADNTGWQSGTYEWGNMYSRIRAANVALQNLENAPFETSVKDRLKGEAHFLRGYYYHQLVRYYGGVPMITKVYGLNEDYLVTRNSFEECINFIVKECDSAQLLLTGKNLDKGRATPLAALALKSRILLYAASDLHYIPVAKTKSSLIASATNTELLGYISGDRIALWQKAKDAAKAVLDLASGYKLNLSAPVSAEEGKMNYMSLAMQGGSSAPGIEKAASTELIFARFFVADQQEQGQRVNLDNGPNGYHNWAGNTPIQELVDDYEYVDNTDPNNVKSMKFDWNNPVHNAAPYKNRDPRFYASILYDGAPWKPRNLVSGNVDPANEIQTGQYDLVQGGNLITFQGLDTRRSSIEDWNGSRTGYYMRKFIDPNPAILDASMPQFVPWSFFRYTEAVLNYVEACIELGDEATARTWLNRIRFRAGMPAITASGDALKEAYRNERRIEMAFEEQRYHDVRRWMIAPQTLGRKPVFINIVGKFKQGKSLAGIYRHDETIYDYTYTPVIDQSHENRKWDDKMYFRPISRDEINKNTDPATKNSKLIQNPGY